jgi:hypothetical protein
MIGVAYHPHAAPHLTSFTPLVGGFFSCVINDDRGGMWITCPPFYFLFCSPLWGGASFLWAMRQRVGDMLPPFHFVPPHHLGGGFLFTPPVDEGDPFNNDRAAHNPHAAPSFNCIYPPHWGGCINLIKNIQCIKNKFKYIL